MVYILQRWNFPTDNSEAFSPIQACTEIADETLIKGLSGLFLAVNSSVDLE